ncbi:DUF6879 family protein [Streptomyces sp. N35]|uniref:DUF6879 family protein n=1 Tax=Streptomyces sp. N35 TaxID=2795730 RepID=UPI0018F69F93|nr:DUF6879 family protein [Streptomyces sp. N35]
MPAKPLEQEWADVTRSAVHLEMRDSYIRDDPGFIAWQEGRTAEAAARYQGWTELMKEATARGVVVRRARIVSEPLSDYTRFEYDVTDAVNLAGGEQVRWLPRRQASDIALPGNDFWVFDGAYGKFNHFTGEGASAGPEPFDDPRIVKLCADAFEAVWERATPHEEYRPV